MPLLQSCPVHAPPTAAHACPLGLNEKRIKNSDLVMAPPSPSWCCYGYSPLGLAVIAVGPWEGKEAQCAAFTTLNPKPIPVLLFLSLSYNVNVVSCHKSFV